MERRPNPKRLRSRGDHVRALTIAILALLIAAPTIAAPTTTARPSVTISAACIAVVDEIEVFRVTVSWSGQDPVATETRLSIRFRGKRLVRTTIRLTPFDRFASATGSHSDDIWPFVPLAPWSRYQDITLVEASGLDFKGTPKRSGPWPSC
jgi:hypothetical protein